MVEAPIYLAGSSPLEQAVIRREHAAAVAVKQRLRVMAAYGERPIWKHADEEDGTRVSHIRSARGRYIGALVREQSGMVRASNPEAILTRANAGYALEFAAALAVKANVHDLPWQISSYTKDHGTLAVGKVGPSFSRAFLFAKFPRGDQIDFSSMSPLLIFNTEEYSRWLKGIYAAEFDLDQPDKQPPAANHRPTADPAPRYDKVRFGEVEVNENGDLRYVPDVARIARWAPPDRFRELGYYILGANRFDSNVVPLAAEDLERLLLSPDSQAHSPVYPLTVDERSLLPPVRAAA